MSKIDIISELGAINAHIALTDSCVWTESSNVNLNTTEIPQKYMCSKVPSLHFPCPGRARISIRTQSRIDKHTSTSANID